MPKKVLIALPPEMLEQVDYIAQCEHRTRSDLIREALRRYLENFRRTSSVQNGVMSVVTATAQPVKTSIIPPVEYRNNNAPGLYNERAAAGES